MIDSRIERMSRALAWTGTRRGVALAVALLAGAKVGEPENEPAATAKKKKPKKCKPGMKRCGTKCVDLATNKANCGTCGARCPATGFCAGGTCAACDVCPGCRYKTIQAAVADAEGPAAIRVCPGTFREVVVIDRDVSVVGAGDGANGTAITSGYNGLVVLVRENRTVSLANLRITGGSSGAVSGGGVRNRGNLTLTGCTVTDSTSWEDGGGLFNDSGAKMMLERCTVSGNHANDNGGGIMNLGDLRLNECRVADNQGGGIKSFGALTAIDTVVEGNTVASHGAGIGSVGPLTLTRSIIRGNRSEAGDGAGVNFGGETAITDCTIADNVARNNGGGIHGGTSTGSVVISGCTISGNRANADHSFASGGGGVFVGGSGTVTLSNCTVRDNGAATQGGGIWNGGTLEVVGCTLEGNDADASGGGICNFRSLTVRNSPIRNNTAEDGAGIYAYDDTTTTVIGCEVSGNTANVTGGGIGTRGVVRLEDSPVTGNRAEGGADAGGGVFAESDGRVTLAGTSRVTGNTPDDCFPAASCGA